MTGVALPAGISIREIADAEGLVKLTDYRGRALYDVRG